MDSANNNNDNDNNNNNGDEIAEPAMHASNGYTSGDVVKKLKAVLSLMASPLTDEVGSTRSVLSGLATIFLAGASIGLVTPGNPVLSPPYRSVSAAIGYVYFLAWSVSFYPQVISNFKRKSVEGLSPDFVVLNVIGFACYTAYNASFFWNTTIQEEYKRRFGPDAEITVQSNDVAFAIHALVLSFVTFCQIIYYNYFYCPGPTGEIDRRTRTVIQLSRPVLAVIVGIVAICVGYPALVLLGKGSSSSSKNDNLDVLLGDDDALARFNWLDFLYLLSYIKIFISLIKYIPQVVLNVRRKSTVGWSIWNILLDFTGGTLSDLQLVLDCANAKDFSGITHNKAKLALGSLSIVFDIIFLVQHYCLYSSAEPTIRNEQNEPLLPTTDSDPEGVQEVSEEEQSQPETIFV
ncbi:unnamed protein product [Pseudo-nitzschia multistriata]|uniref:Cystinosin n=1 Tax=Pseudo-nitzschia multistriata TaxID=183589 RepID=A0A448YVA3_9STRA|nr:unnamed protein product [Pseudo-nitzschia multistriata]